MSNQPLFSIITVTLNNLDGLQKTAESLLHQTGQSFEWIVIDGGSKDGTKDFLSSVILSASEGSHAFKHKDSSASPQNDRFFWISESDQGIYDAMNKGIDRAQGKFLLFLNAGDVLAANTVLDELRSYIEERSFTPDFVYGDSYETLSTGINIYKPARPYIKRTQGMFTHHQAMLYRRSKVTDLRYDLNYKIAADYDFTCRFLKDKEKILYYPQPICVFAPGGVSQQNVQMGRKEQFQIRKKLSLVALPLNVLFYIEQSLLWGVRRLFPGLYWRLKRS